MPDWKQIVRKKLRVLGACSPEFTEELAAHLEDHYDALLCEGLPAEVAFQHTIGQIEGRCRVRLMRFLQEDLMAGFIREVALPGLLTSAAAGLLSEAFEFIFKFLYLSLNNLILFVVGIGEHYYAIKYGIW